jgi:hypothetical protein
MEKEVEEVQRSELEEEGEEGEEKCPRVSFGRIVISK